MTISEFAKIYPGIIDEDNIKDHFIKSVVDNWEECRERNSISYYMIFSKAPLWLFVKEYNRWFENEEKKDFYRDLKFDEFIDESVPNDEVPRLVNEICEAIGKPNPVINEMTKEEAEANDVVAGRCCAHCKFFMKNGDRNVCCKICCYTCETDECRHWKHK